MRRLCVFIPAALAALSWAFLSGPASAQDVTASAPRTGAPIAVQGKPPTTYVITVLSKGKAARTATYLGDHPYPLPLDGPVETCQDKNGRRIIFQAADYYGLPFEMSYKSLSRVRERGKTVITLKGNVRIGIKQSERRVLLLTGEEATIIVRRDDSPARRASPGKQSLEMLP